MFNKHKELLKKSGMELSVSLRAFSSNDEGDNLTEIIGFDIIPSAINSFPQTAINKQSIIHKEI